MIWHALQFDWPSAALLLLLLIPILWIALFIDQYRQQKLHEFASQAVQDVVVEPREPAVYWLKVTLFCLAWICGVFALMQPKGNERYVSTTLNGEVAVTKRKTPETAIMRKKAHEVIFLVDASASMKIADINGRTRFDVAKEIIDDVIRNLKGENVSLFAFTSATIQVVPSTLDYFFTRLMLQQVAINEGETAGTDFKQALEFLKKLYFTTATATAKTVVILSDGGDTHLVGLTGDQKNEAIANIISPVADAAEKNLRVLTVGLGSAKGKDVPGVSFQGRSVMSTLEEPLLRKLSTSARGELFVSGEMTPFEISKAIYQNIARNETFVDASVYLPPPDRGNNTRVYDYYYQYPLAIAILALMGYLFIPDTRKRISGGTS